MNHGKIQGDTYLDLQIHMKGPSSLEESPKEPSPIDEEPTPGEGEEYSPEEEGSAPYEEEERRSDVVDAKSVDDDYKYRLARVLKPGDNRVVAIHVNISKCFLPSLCHQGRNKNIFRGRRGWGRRSHFS